MQDIKDQIEQLFIKELKGTDFDSFVVTKDTVEMKLNSIVSKIVSKLDFGYSYKVPLKETSNNNDIFSGTYIEELKSSDIELSSMDKFSIDTKPKVQESTTIPKDYKLTNDMEQYARSKHIHDVQNMFDEFKSYYLSTAKLRSDWEAAWHGWIARNNKYKNHLIKTTIDENMKLTDDLIKIAQNYIPKNLIDIEFTKFKNYYIANGDLKVSWEKVWENWCINHKQFAPKEQKQSKNMPNEKAQYKWDFKKAKDVSDRIKDWLEFEKGINWLEDFYLKDIPLPGIGWQEVQHPDFNKTEILLFKKDSPDGAFLLEHQSEDVIDVKVLEND